MDIESQVVSLDLAKKLKYLGVKQRSIFFWDVLSPTAYAVEFVPFHCPGLEHYSAFTVAELGLIAKDFNEGNLEHLEIDYFDTYNFFNIVIKQLKIVGFESFYIRDLTEANVRARAIIFIIENNLVTEEWRKKWLTQ